MISPKINPQEVINKINTSIDFIEQFDFDALTEEEQQRILEKLNEVERIALEIKLKAKRSQQQK